jgi:hypothetical protein
MSGDILVVRLASSGMSRVLWGELLVGAELSQPPLSGTHLYRAPHCRHACGQEPEGRKPFHCQQEGHAMAGKRRPSTVRTGRRWMSWFLGKDETHPSCSTPMRI